MFINSNEAKCLCLYNGLSHVSVSSRCLMQRWLINFNWKLTKTNSEILIKIRRFSFKQMHLKIQFAKLRPFCLGLNAFDYMMANSAHFQLSLKSDIDSHVEGCRLPRRRPSSSLVAPGAVLMMTCDVPSFGAFLT